MSTEIVEARFIAAIIKDSSGDYWRENRELSSEAFENYEHRNAWRQIAGSSDYKTAEQLPFAWSFLKHTTCLESYVSDRTEMWLSVLRTRGLGYAPEWFRAVKGIQSKGSLPEKLAACLFDPLAVLAEPRVIYRIGKAPICTEGNLTTITAEAKAGKTAYVESFIAAAVTRSQQIDALGVTGRNEGEAALLHFDTEQSPHDHAAVLNRALRRASREAWPKWFRSYRLAGKEPGEAQALLDYALELARNDCGGTFAAIIDGVGDFVYDVNDQKECNPLVLHLHEQAIAHQTNIISVLHVNPGSLTGKTRGHLGSHLERKAATNLLLEKESEVTTVWSKKNRGAPITKADGPRFSWDDVQKMHASVESGRTSKEEERRNELHEVLVEALAGKPSATFTDLVAGVERVQDCGTRTAKSRLAEMKKLKVTRFVAPNLYAPAA